jgi:hypothetical protein
VAFEQEHPPNHRSDPVKKLVITFASVLLLGAAVIFLTADESASSTKLVVYKSPTCGCCESWVEHMRDAGFEVEIHDVDDVNPVKSEHGVDRRLAACHTAIIDGYVIEGHVPAQDVVQLLAERPAVLGLAVPGMPAGSPGMELPNPAQHQDYQVLAFDGRGRTAVFREVAANSTP